jgi:hypothetical protein
MNVLTKPARVKQPKLTKIQKDTLRRLAIMVGDSGPLKLGPAAKDMIDKLLPVIVDRAFPRIHQCVLCSATTDNLLRDGWMAYGLISREYPSAIAGIDGPVCPAHEEDEDYERVFSRASRMLRSSLDVV